MEKAIGGYFELEHRFESEYYSDLIRLNSGRNCLEYILTARKYKKIYLPMYVCSAVLEPILKLNLDFEFYRITKSLEAEKLIEPKVDECFLIINYFGLKGRYIESVSKKINNLIVDNSQAFFERAIPDVDTFYSVRKFFGVADGAYLSTNCKLEEDILQETSWKRYEYLLRRLENGANDGYAGFLENEEYLKGKEITKMSNLTYQLLAGINYKSVRIKRNQNFQHLHLKLKTKNKLSISNIEIDGPMVYPLYVEQTGLKEELISQKIYIATYWPNVLENSDSSQLEYNLAEKLLPLPVDQRYGLLDMDRICKVLNSLL